RRPDLREFGRLLHESWLLKKSMGSGVSIPEIDRMYEAARSAGALGGKLLGAGGGGFLLLYVEEPCRPAVRKALASKLEVTFNFESNGTHIVFYDPQRLAPPPDPV
nr:kinase [bacterium]